MCVFSDLMWLNKREFTFLFIVFSNGKQEKITWVHKRIVNWFESNVKGKSNIKMWEEMNVWKEKKIIKQNVHSRVSRICDIAAADVASAWQRCDTIRWSCVFVLNVLCVRYGYCRFILEAENASWEIPICDSLQKNIYVYINVLNIYIYLYTLVLANAIVGDGGFEIVFFFSCYCCCCYCCCCCCRSAYYYDVQKSQAPRIRVLRRRFCWYAVQSKYSTEYSAAQRARTQTCTHVQSYR